MTIEERIKNCLAAHPDWDDRHVSRCNRGTTLAMVRAVREGSPMPAAPAEVKAQALTASGTITLESVRARIKFVSIEPFFGETPLIQKKDKLDWIIVGRLTGHGRSRDPEYSAIGWIIAQATELEIPIFMKDNLKNILHCAPLIQEYPR